MKFKEIKIIDLNEYLIGITQRFMQEEENARQTFTG